MNQNDLDEVKSKFPGISDDVLAASNLITKKVVVSKTENTMLKPLNGSTVGNPRQRDTSERSGKFNATRTDYNGIIYPSKHEALTARDLDLQIKAGEIDFYLRQVPFVLPGGIIYRADFLTFKQKKSNWPFWDIKVIESKGYPTPTWRLKLKLFKEAYPNLEIKIV